MRALLEALSGDSLDLVHDKVLGRVVRVILGGDLEDSGDHLVVLVKVSADEVGNLLRCERALRSML